MRFVADPDPGTFAAQALVWLHRDPVRHNVICTLVDTYQHGDRPPEPDSRWLRVTAGTQTHGAAIQIPPRGLLLSVMPETAAAALAEHLAPDRPRLPTVDGPAAPTRAFADRYAELTGCAVTQGMSSRIYRLDRVQPPDGIPGRLREATADDRELVLRWADEFSREADAGHPPSDPAPQVDARLRRGGMLWLWEYGGEPVSFLWLSVPVAGVVRVSAVYTPPELRGNGYASACVAGASQRALDAGARACMLYADLANPTSNNIYQRIGYRPVDDSDGYRFS
jgi:predicted GNAT family acetyltransferase